MRSRCCAQVRERIRITYGTHGAVAWAERRKARAAGVRSLRQARRCMRCSVHTVPRTEPPFHRRIRRAVTGTGLRRDWAAPERRAGGPRGVGGGHAHLELTAAGCPHGRRGDGLDRGR